MSILGKTFELAKKAGSAAINSASRKLEEAKQKRLQEEQMFLQRFPYKYRCTIRQQDSTNVDLMVWEILEKDAYIVYDAEDTPIYIAKGTAFMGKHHFKVTSPDKKQHCKIHKALFKVPVPFIKDRKSCKVRLTGKEPFIIKTYISFKKREYAIEGRDMSIEADKKEKEFKIFRNDRTTPCIHIYKVRSDEGFFRDKYYVGFNDARDEMLAIATTIGIDTIRYSE